MEVPKDQITTLLEHGLYNSAQILGCFLVSSATNAETSPQVKAENLALLGDALFREKEHRRALHTYKQALQHYKIIPKQNTTASRSSLSTSNRSSSPNSVNISAINENEVKFKIALCHCALSENRAALVEMEGIPSKTRTLHMNLTMGKLYRNSRHNRAAIACYKECLRHCPYIMEAITALAELGASAKDIISLFPQTPNRSGRPPLDHFDSCRWLQALSLLLLRFVSSRRRQTSPISLAIFNDILDLLLSNPFRMDLSATFTEITKRLEDLEAYSTGFGSDKVGAMRGDYQLVTGLKFIWNKAMWVQADGIDEKQIQMRYVEAQCCIASNDYKGGLELFTELLQRFPNNVHILLEIAKVEAIIGKNDEAIMNFEKARSFDPYIVSYMDEYAMLLKMKSDHSKLNKLVHDLLSIDPTRAEVFVAMSVLWERKDERGALAYAEKSIRIDERHIPGYIMKGNLFLSLNRPDAAVTAFRGAQELRPDLRSYQGLVRSYLALSKIKEALYAAREAMKAMPQSAKALKLVGDVHASNPGGREKAKKFYESALRLEPGYLGAALALAELHVAEGRNGDAVSLLERYLKDWADDSLHVKLAQVFAAMSMMQEALSHYQAALRINPQCEAAKKGLERLEKQMKGVDPDAPEEDEENEVEDAEGDQEDAELL
ncbi:hypothetical protein HHK36_026555 [Tetracentron sinense]|uniref:Anaphase-promoting complex subunit 7 n=1 Tax=Tetracentron sinense TaxID=13715 RepID=A0A834YJP3_TETSI|nr:hypothetical protein HHK36_026555 [Tetracentron sinense]